MSPFEIKPQSGELGPGQYDVEIVEAVLGVNSKGNDNLRLRFETPDGREIVDWIVVSLPQTQWRVKQVCEAAGLEFPDGGGTIDEADLVGKRVGIEVVEEEYQGVVRAKVKDVFTPIGSDVPLETEGLPEPGAAGSTKGDFAAAAGIEDDEEAPF